MMVTMFLGSIIVFLLSNAIPQDAIEIRLANLNLSEDNDNYQREYAKLYIEDNRQLPLFYFSILPNHYHTNIRSFVHKKERNFIESLQGQQYDCSKITDASIVNVTSLQKSSFHFPKIVFHGLRNQYHKYITDFITGKLGESKKDGKAVGSKISSALHWTISILLVNFLLSVLLSLIISYYLIKYDGRFIEKIFSGLTLIFYSIPGFWLATLVLIFFTGDQYGMPIFYTPLFIDVDDKSYISILTVGWSKILPVIFCLTILDVAYLTRMLKANLKEELQKPYISALKSRGLSMKDIIIQHAYANVMIPFVTLIVGSLPLALAGSIVYELVFNIPGVGRLLYDSIYGADWKVVYAIVLLILMVTVIFYSVAEWIYRWLDPRI
jgi:peptide/nickel transport system permease protein